MMTDAQQQEAAPAPAAIEALALTLGGISSTIAAILITLVGLGFGQLEQKIGARLRGVFEIAGILSLIAAANCVDYVADRITKSPSQLAAAIQEIPTLPNWIDRLFVALKLPAFGPRIFRYRIQHKLVSRIS